MNDDKAPERVRSKLDASISQSNLAALLAEMEAAPPKQKETFTPKEAIDEHRALFNAYREKGYSLQDLSKLFGKYECDVTSQALGQHMSGKKQPDTTSRSAKSSKSKAAGTGRKPKVQPDLEAGSTDPITTPTARVASSRSDRPPEVRNGLDQGTGERWAGAAPAQSAQRAEVAKPQVDAVITMDDL